MEWVAGLGGVGDSNIGGGEESEREERTGVNRRRELLISCLFIEENFRKCKELGSDSL